MAGIPQIVVTPIHDWTETVDADLAKAVSDPAIVHVFRREWETQALIVWQVAFDGEAIAHFATRLDADALAQKELVIVAAGGRHPKIQLLATVLPFLEKMAVDLGCKAVRIHTARRGMMRQLAGRDYRETEIVFRKDL